MKDTDNKTSVLFTTDSYFVIDTQCSGFNLKHIQNIVNNNKINQLSIDIRLSINSLLSAIN